MRSRVRSEIGELHMRESGLPTEAYQQYALANDAHHNTKEMIEIIARVLVILLEIMD
jgi:hypothetical protein